MLLHLFPASLPSCFLFFHYFTSLRENCFLSMKIGNFIFLLLSMLHCYYTYSQQQEKVSFSVFDGTIVAGYVDQGAFLNFLEPNINFSKGNSRITLGMLPSLRFKEDNSIPKNSPVTPNLGGGITYTYKKIAFQVPFYYNAKTAVRNGSWTTGIGMGYRFK